MDFNGVLTDFFNGLDSPLNRSDLYWDLFFFFFFRTEQKKKEKKKKKGPKLVIEVFIFCLFAHLFIFTVASLK